MSSKSSSTVHGPLLRSISSSTFAKFSMFLLIFKLLPFSSIEEEWPTKRDSGKKNRDLLLLLCVLNEKESVFGVMCREIMDGVCIHRERWRSWWFYRWNKIDDNSSLRFICNMWDKGIDGRNIRTVNFPNNL